jgi:hypothetical protein
MNEERTKMLDFVLIFELNDVKENHGEANGGLNDHDA